jgi:hypothetical protein
MENPAVTGRTVKDK